VLDRSVRRIVLGRDRVIAITLLRFGPDFLGRREWLWWRVRVDVGIGVGEKTLLREDRWMKDWKGDWHRKGGRLGARFSMRPRGRRIGNCRRFLGLNLGIWC